MDKKPVLDAEDDKSDPKSHTETVVPTLSAVVHFASLIVGFVSNEMILTICDVSILNNFDC